MEKDLFELAKMRRQEDRFSHICLNKRRKPGVFIELKDLGGGVFTRFRRNKGEIYVSFTPDKLLGSQTSGHQQQLGAGGLVVLTSLKVFFSSAKQAHKSL